MDASSTPASETATAVLLASICLSKGRTSKGVVIGHDYPALLRARRRRERWSKEDQRLYQRHRWRSEGFHGEAKTWHGLARAVRRGGSEDEKNHRQLPCPRLQRRPSRIPLCGPSCTVKRSPAIEDFELQAVCSCSAHKHEGRPEGRPPCKRTRFRSSDSRESESPDIRFRSSRCRRE